MIKLSFEKMTPETFDGLVKDIENTRVLEAVVKEHKGVVFALYDGEKYTAASAMMFEMNDELLTEALRKLYLSGLYLSDNAEQGHDGMMLEYTVDQAAYMGYDLLTARVALNDMDKIKFYTSHGFDKIVRADCDEDGEHLILQRDIKIKIKCCGFYR